MKIPEEEQKRFSEWKATVDNAFISIKNGADYEKTVNQLNDKLDVIYNEILNEEKRNNPNLLNSFIGYARMINYLEAKSNYFPHECWNDKYPKWFQHFKHLSNPDETFRKINNYLMENHKALNDIKDDFALADMLSDILNQYIRIGSTVMRDIEKWEIDKHTLKNASEDVTECNAVTILLNNDDLLYKKLPKSLFETFKNAKMEFEQWEEFLIYSIIWKMQNPFDWYAVLVDKKAFDAFAQVICDLAIFSNGFKTIDGEIIQYPDNIYIYTADLISKYIYTNEYKEDEKDANIFPIKEEHGNKSGRVYEPKLPEYAQSDKFREWLQRLSSIDSMKQINSNDKDLAEFAKNMFDIDISKPPKQVDKSYVEFLSDFFDREIKKDFQQYSDMQIEDLIKFIDEYVSNRMPTIKFERKPLEDFFRYGVNNGRILEELNNILKEDKMTEVDFILDAEFALHDSWVREHAQEYNTISNANKSKFLPSELIGFERLTNYYKIVKDFIQRLFKNYAYYIDVTLLENVYNLRVKEYFLNNRITSSDNAAKMLSKGSLSYEPLGLAERYKEYIVQSEGNAMTFEEYCKELLNTIPITKTREKIVKEIVTNPNALNKDISRLMPNEVTKRLNEGLRNVNIEDVLRFLAGAESDNSIIESKLTPNEVTKRLNEGLRNVNIGDVLRFLAGAERDNRDNSIIESNNNVKAVDDGYGEPV